MELLLIIIGFALVILGAIIYVKIVKSQKEDYDMLMRKLKIAIRIGYKTINNKTVSEMIAEARDYECADLDMLEDLENEYNKQ